MRAVDIKTRFEKNVAYEPNTGCWLWIGYLDEAGYGRISDKRISVGAHRISYTLYKSPNIENLCVCHHCDNRSCVNPDHLFIGTRAENNEDRDRKGRAKKYYKGSDNENSRLTWSEVDLIRANASLGPMELGRRFKVTEGNIRYILKGKTWKR